MKQITNTCNNMDKFQKYMLSKTRKQRVHTQVHLYEILEKGNLIYGDRELISGCLEPGMDGN